MQTPVLHVNQKLWHYCINYLLFCFVLFLNLIDVQYKKTVFSVTFITSYSLFVQTTQAHVNAMVVPEAAGNRHIVCAHNLWLKDIAAIFDKEFKPLGYKVPTKEAPLFVMKMVAAFDKTARMVMPAWGKVYDYDNTRMTSVLGVQPRPARDTLVDMGHSMIEKGFIKKTKKYKEHYRQ